MTDDPTAEELAAYQLELVAQAKAITMDADDKAANALADDILDLMVASDASKATMFAVMTMVIASWVSVIGCAGCRSVEVSRMGLLALHLCAIHAKANGGDDGDYHATRH